MQQTMFQKPENADVKVKQKLAPHPELPENAKPTAPQLTPQPTTQAPVSDFWVDAETASNKPDMSTWCIATYD